MIRSIVSVASRNLRVHGYEDDPDVSRDDGLRPTRGNKETRRKKRREIRQKRRFDCVCQVAAGPGDRIVRYQQVLASVFKAKYFSYVLVAESCEHGKISSLCLGPARVFFCSQDTHSSSLFFVSLSFLLGKSSFFSIYLLHEKPLRDK